MNNSGFFKPKRKQQSKRHLRAGFLEVSYNVVSVLNLLKTTKGHFSTGDVFFGVLKVVVHSLLVPHDTFLLIGLSVRVTRSVTRSSAKNTMKVRTNFVGTTFLGGVALKTSGFKKVCTLF